MWTAEEVCGVAEHHRRTQDLRQEVAVLLS